MDRQTLDNGRWFNREAALSWKEDSRFRETLYRTKGGHWILHAWSQRQGSEDTWTEIDDEDAARWLARNEHELHPACAEEFAALEVI